MGSENKNIGKDKDFGFPFVEVKPLEAKKKMPPKKEVAEAPIPVDSKAIDIINAEKSIERPFSAMERKKRSSKPVVVSLAFLIILVLVVMGYFLYFLPQEDQTSTTVTSVPIQQSPPPSTDEQSNTETLEALNPDAAEVVEPTGSAIVETSTGQLTIVTERGARPSYYIIAGSLPNERLAKGEAQEFMDKGMDVILIYPQGDINNYRLSVGRYESFQSATEALEPARANFGESLWILKY